MHREDLHLAAAEPTEQLEDHLHQVAVVAAEPTGEEQHHLHLVVDEPKEDEPQDSHPKDYQGDLAGPREVFEIQVAWRVRVRVCVCEVGRVRVCLLVCLLNCCVEVGRRR